MSENDTMSLVDSWGLGCFVSLSAQHKLKRKINSIEQASELVLFVSLWLHSSLQRLIQSEPTQTPQLQEAMGEDEMQTSEGAS